MATREQWKAFVEGPVWTEFGGILDKRIAIEGTRLELAGTLDEVRLLQGALSAARELRAMPKLILDQKETDDGRSEG